MKCYEKVRYPEKAHAEEAVRRVKDWHIANRPGEDLSRLNAYLCKTCSFWHIGKRPERREYAPTVSVDQILGAP